MRSIDELIDELCTFKGPMDPAFRGHLGNMREDVARTFLDEQIADERAK